MVHLPDHGKTRWLTFVPLLRAILSMFPAFTTYFRSCGKVASLQLRNLFDETHSLMTEIYFEFLSFALEPFQNFNLIVQANSFCYVELIAKMRQFKARLHGYEGEKFVGIKTQELLDKFEEDFGRQKRNSIEQDLLVCFFKDNLFFGNIFLPLKLVFLPKNFFSRKKSFLLK